MTLGLYDEPTAELILATVRQLIRSGYVLPGGDRPQVPNLERPVYFRNVSGAAIPPFSLMQTTGTEDIGELTYYKVDQYDDAVQGIFLFSGAHEIADDETGVAQRGPYYLAQGDGSTVTAGELWGPVEADWELADNGGPFVAIGEDQIRDDVLWVQRDPQNVYVAEVTTQVTAKSGSTLGSGVVKLQPIGNGWTISDGQTAIDVGSMVSGTIAVGATVVVSRAENGKLIVIAEDCG